MLRPTERPPPLLSSQAPEFEEVLDWPQIKLTGDWKGAHVIPEATSLGQPMITEGVPIFAPNLSTLCLHLPEDYAPPGFLF